jgi:hypothetical protein
MRQSGASQNLPLPHGLQNIATCELANRAVALTDTQEQQKLSPEPPSEA